MNTKIDLTILYAEDEDEIRLLVEKYLNRIFTRVISAANGKEALELFETHKVDLLLTDITMPKMDGLTLSQEVKKISPELPIVIVTAFSDTEFLFKAIEIGISSYLTKPIDGTKLKLTLMEIAQALLQKRELEETKKKQQELLLKTHQQELEILRLKEKHNQAEQEIAFRKELKIIQDELSHKLINNFYFETYYNPVEHLSGDTYFAKELKDGSCLFYIIDAMGEGVGASVTSINASSYINFIVKEKGVFELETLIEKYLQYVKSIILPEEMIATTFLLINANQTVAKIANFGMSPALICKSNQTVTKLKSNNLPIMLPTESFNIQELSLEDIEKIMIHSDGVDEINTKDNEHYSNIIANDFKESMSKKLFLEKYNQKVQTKEDDKTAIFIFRQPSLVKQIRSFVIENNSIAVEEGVKICEETIKQIEKDQKEIIMFSMVIREMLINAFEHGNLEIDFDQKQELIEKNQYEEYIQNLLKQKKYQNRKIKCSIELRGDKDTKFIWISIEDEGKGFDASNIFKYLNFEDGKRFHGRGIKISDQIADAVLYNQKGNCVIIMKKIIQKE